jgi:hypothetical protein
VAGEIQCSDGNVCVRVLFGVALKDVLEEGGALLLVERFVVGAERTIFERPNAGESGGCLACIFAEAGGRVTAGAVV